MHVKHQSQAVTVDASGDGTWTTNAINGTILQISYVDDDYSASWDLSIIGNTTGLNVGTNTAMAAADLTWTPGRNSLKDDISTLAAGCNGAMVLADETLTFTIANAGNGTSGTFHIWYG